jgi:hypothetical protein
VTEIVIDKLAVRAIFVSVHLPAGRRQSSETRPRPTTTANANIGLRHWANDVYAVRATHFAHGLCELVAH